MLKMLIDEGADINARVCVLNYEYLLLNHVNQLMAINFIDVPFQRILLH